MRHPCVITHAERLSVPLHFKTCHVTKFLKGLRYIGDNIKMDHRAVVCGLDSQASGCVLVVGCCEHGFESPCFIKDLTLSRRNLYIRSIFSPTGPRIRLFPHILWVLHLSFLKSGCESIWSSFIYVSYLETWGYISVKYCLTKELIHLNVIKTPWWGEGELGG